MTEAAARRVLIDKDGVRALIPHTGLMCLLDGVLDWNDEAIVCTSETHRHSNNPLRRDGRLAALHAFEYCAQAIAVHGGLRARAAGVAPPAGYLAGLRDARLQVAYLDDATSALMVRAARLFGDAGNCIYETQVSAAGTVLAQARITIMLRVSPTWKREL